MMMILNVGLMSGGMMSDSGSSGGLGLCGLIFVVLLVLKLTDNIDWSWWLVTAPLWGGFAFL